MTVAGSTASAPLDAAAYRAAMSRLASAVHLVTTAGPGGRAGFTASAVCSVSDAPPTLLVCINRTSSAYDALSRNEALCVNTLGAGHEAVASLFGGRTPMHARFLDEGAGAGAWRILPSGVPALADALARFECRIVARHPVGSHDVLYCAVEAVAAGCEAGALLYSERRYRTLPPEPRPIPAEPARTARGVGPRPAGAPPPALRSA